MAVSAEYALAVDAGHRKATLGLVETSCLLQGDLSALSWSSFSGGSGPQGNSADLTIRFPSDFPMSSSLDRNSLVVKVNIIS